MKGFFASCEKYGCLFYPAFYIYTRMYREVVRREVELGNITSQDVVLNVGCGAIPFTAIHISQLTGAKVVALDKDPEAVKKARYSLEKFQLNKNIEIYEGDGVEDIPVPFNVAIIALQVDRKSLVYQNLSNQTNGKGRLIFRQPVDKFNQEYGNLSLDLVPDDWVLQNMKTFNYSNLYLTT
ncbi:methyltransferase domain-containing protein [Natranaerobius thermophilus]|uniref:Methyltransferase domain-containing protein n=1 Tax=Natranaerobius thermophilus (strain ATCC BAA-1301 / DSM 18059 / JW/NM-WN-LF) TaxID=457570 RepID=B2A2W3_NATTJ|nr:methyltransferase domain-containing protein [Natranaerobius thermophilus]ACB86331.1 conserved hypothetical protein [Natranaerobius thermophilus JW/NM-WN-LF]